MSQSNINPDTTLDAAVHAIELIFQKSAESKHSFLTEKLLNSGDTVFSLTTTDERKDELDNSHDDSAEEIQSSLVYEIHLQVSCDGCGEYCFVGSRFRCMNCRNYDLCADCMYTYPLSSEGYSPHHQIITQDPEKMKEHPLSHIFLRVGGLARKAASWNFCKRDFAGVNNFLKSDSSRINSVLHNISTMKLSSFPTSNGITESQIIAKTSSDDTISSLDPSATQICPPLDPIDLHFNAPSEICPSSARIKTLIPAYLLPQFPSSNALFMLFGVNWRRVLLACEQRRVELAKESILVDENPDRRFEAVFDSFENSIIDPGPEFISDDQIIQGLSINGLLSFSTAISYCSPEWRAQRFFSAQLIKLLLCPELDPPHAEYFTEEEMQKTKLKEKQRWAIAMSDFPSWMTEGKSTLSDSATNILLWSVWNERDAAMENPLSLQVFMEYFDHKFHTTPASSLVCYRIRKPKFELNVFLLPFVEFSRINLFPDFYSSNLPKTLDGLPSENNLNAMMEEINLSNSIVLFVSHQWLSEAHPDPEGLDCKLIHDRLWRDIAICIDGIQLLFALNMCTREELLFKLNSNEAVQCNVDFLSFPTKVTIRLCKIVVSFLTDSKVLDLKQRQELTQKVAERFFLWVDYSCLPQNHPSRDEEQTIFFRQSLLYLADIQLSTDTLILDRKKEYIERAWCLAEMLVATTQSSLKSLCKPYNLFQTLLISPQVFQNLLNPLLFSSTEVLTELKLHITNGKSSEDPVCRVLWRFLQIRAKSYKFDVFNAVTINLVEPVLLAVGISIGKVDSWLQKLEALNEVDFDQWRTMRVELKEELKTLLMQQSFSSHSSLEGQLDENDNISSRVVKELKSWDIFLCVSGVDRGNYRAAFDQDIAAIRACLPILTTKRPSNVHYISIYYAPEPVSLSYIKSKCPFVIAYNTCKKRNVLRIASLLIPLGLRLQN